MSLLNNTPCSRMKVIGRVYPYYPYQHMACVRIVRINPPYNLDMGTGPVRIVRIKPSYNLHTGDDHLAGTTMSLLSHRPCLRQKLIGGYLPSAPSTRCFRMIPTLNLVFQYPPDWPEALVEELYGNIQPTAKRWGEDTFTRLKRFLRQHPSERTAIQINGFRTNMIHQGETICILLAMMLRPKQSDPDQFVCFMGSEKQVTCESDRIVAAVQAEAISKKSITTIAEA
jgi:hypothetical protein